MIIVYSNDTLDCNGERIYKMCLLHSLVYILFFLITISKTTNIIILSADIICFVPTNHYFMG